MKNFPKIALGTWAWGTGAAGGDQVFGHQLGQEELTPVFQQAMVSGLNLWDTASVYGMGSSEALLGDFVRTVPRDQILVSTKFTPQMADKASKAPVTDLVDASLERLVVDAIDMYWIHNPTDFNRWTDELITLLDSGKILQVGISNHNLEQIKTIDTALQAAGHRLAAVQNHYSLLYRASEQAGVLDYCKENNIIFFAYMVLEQGALSGKYNPEHPMPEGSGRGDSYNGVLAQLETLTNKMRDIGQDKNASVAQIAIAWAIAKGTLPIIGVSKAAQAEDAAHAATVRLSDAEVAELEQFAEKTGVDTRGAWENKMI